MLFAIQLEYDLMCNKFYRVWETTKIDGKVVNRPVSQEFGTYDEAQVWLVKRMVSTTPAFPVREVV